MGKMPEQLRGQFRRTIYDDVFDDSEQSPEYGCHRLSPLGVPPTFTTPRGLILILRNTSASFIRAYDIPSLARVDLLARPILTTSRSGLACSLCLPSGSMVVLRFLCVGGVDPYGNPDFGPKLGPSISHWPRSVF